MNCSSRVNSHFTGRPVFMRGEHAEIFGEHFLLAAEPAADALGKDVKVASLEAKQMAELLLGDERRL